MRRADKKGYEIHGAFYPSATTVLSVWPKHLDNWKLKLCRESVLQQYEAYTQNVGVLSIAPITKNLLQTWLEEGSKAHRQALNEASAHGTEVHKAIEAFWSGSIIPNLSQAAQRAYAQFEKWVADQVLMGRCEAELMVHSDDPQAAGTLDLLYQSNFEWRIRDWKTSSGIYDNHMVQLAFYAHCVEEMKGVEVADVGVVRLTKSGPDKYEEKILKREEWLELVPVFKACRALWQHINGHKYADSHHNTYQRLSLLLAPLSPKDYHKDKMRSLASKLSGLGDAELANRVNYHFSTAQHMRLKGECKSVCGYILAELDKGA